MSARTLSQRDKYILAEALALALAADARLPRERREPSNQKDREGLINALVPPSLEAYLRQAAVAKLNLIWPEGDVP